jgi:pectin methylesterase-like acyl-CoA thioesterase
MKQKISILIIVLITSLKLFAGAVSVPIASGATVTTIQTVMSDAVAATNTDITLQFAKGGTWGSAAADLTIAVPAGVTKLSITSDPATTGAVPVLYVNTLTYADGLMTEGIVFDGVKVMTAIASRYLIQPSASSTTKIPAKITIKNCWVEGFRCVFSSTIATVTTELTYVNNIFKNLANEGAFRVSTGTIQKVTIRNNTFINVGGDASGTAATDYFIDFRSPNSVTSQINFSNNTIYYPRTQGRGLFRTSGNFTTGYLKENNNIYSTGNATSFALQLLYNNVTGAITDTDSTNYYSNKMTLGTNKGSIVTTVYTENTPSNLFLNASADDFTLNDPNFAGKNKAGDPRWFPKAVSNPAVVSTSVFPANAGTVTPSSVTVDAGTSVSLSATRNFGFQFKHWQDAAGNVLSTNATNSFNVVKDTSIIAVFDVIPTHNYNVNMAGSQWGTVSLSPAPTGGKYETGTIVSMTAVNDSVSTFLNWEDATTGKVRSITVDGDKTFTATFSEKAFIVGWDLVTPDPKSSRPGDYYSKAANKGVFSAYEPTGTAVNWLTYTGGGIPCGLLWTSNISTRRYYKASFSTTGYKNINVHSNMFAYNQSYYVGQKMQYSTDGTNFTDLATCSLVNSNWVHFPATLPQALEDQAVVYLRWIADETSTAVGTGNDGTGISNIYVFAEEIATFDPVKPTLVSTVPTNNATGASANGSITLTFDKNVKAGTGSCTLGSTVLTPVFGSKTATFNYTKLAYNTAYTFTVPAGALTNVDGVAFEGVTISFTTMNRPTPSAKLFDAVVAKDGSGDYSSVIAAISAAPTGRTQPWLIFVKNGTYSGHVEIPANKPYINLIGQSRDNVIISDARISGSSATYPDSVVYAVDPGATVVVKSANCYFENICFENKFGYDNLAGPQALALYTQNDRTILNNCWLRSYQDTYLTSYGNVAYRHYIKDCRIEGAVDFIYGGGDVFFDKCTLYLNRSAGGYIVAPSHQVGTQWGYVFSNCTIDGPSPSYITYLGRPWANSPKASYFNTTAKINIYPAGWLEHMGAIPAVFADYNTVDANGDLTDMSARIDQYWIGDVSAKVWGTAKKSFTNEEAATYTLNNVLTGSDAWDPISVVEKTENPTNVINTSGTLTWNNTSYAICYVILKNNVVVGFTTTNTFTDLNYSAVKRKLANGASETPIVPVYQVVAVSESGALSSPTTATPSGISTGLESSKTKVTAYFNDKNLVVNNLELGSIIAIYSVNGVLINKQSAKTNTVSIPVNIACILKVTSNNESVSFKLIK